jgi:hypothetical protein
VTALTVVTEGGSYALNVTTAPCVPQFTNPITATRDESVGKAAK